MRHSGRCCRSSAHGFAQGSLPLFGNQPGRRIVRGPLESVMIDEGLLQGIAASHLWPALPIVVTLAPSIITASVRQANTRRPVDQYRARPTLGLIAALDRLGRGALARHRVASERGSTARECCVPFTRKFIETVFGATSLLAGCPEAAELAHGKWHHRTGGENLAPVRFRRFCVASIWAPHDWLPIGWTSDSSAGS